MNDIGEQARQANQSRTWRRGNFSADAAQAGDQTAGVVGMGLTHSNM